MTPLLRLWTFMRPVGLVRLVLPPIYGEWLSSIYSHLTVGVGAYDGSNIETFAFESALSTTQCFFNLKHQAEVSE